MKRLIKTFTTLLLLIFSKSLVADERCNSTFQPRQPIWFIDGAGNNTPGQYDSLPSLYNFSYSLNPFWNYIKVRDIGRSYQNDINNEIECYVKNNTNASKIEIHLIGYSMGGASAVELSQRLISIENISLNLYLIDPWYFLKKMAIIPPEVNKVITYYQNNPSRCLYGPYFGVPSDRGVNVDLSKTHNHCTIFEEALNQIGNELIKIDQFKWVKLKMFKKRILNRKTGPLG